MKYRLVPPQKVVRRRVQLPELADVRALPSPRVGGWPRPRDGDLDAMLDGPVPHLRAVQRPPEQAPRLARGEGVGVAPVRAVGREHAPEEAVDLVGPRLGAVAAGHAGQPLAGTAGGPRGQERAAQFVQSRLSDLEFLHGLVAGERSFDEPGHDVSDVGDAQTVLDLLFHGAPHSTPRDSAFANYTGARPPRGASKGADARSGSGLAPPRPRPAGLAAFANYSFPLLLSPRHCFFEDGRHPLR